MNQRLIRYTHVSKRNSNSRGVSLAEKSGWLIQEGRLTPVSHNPVMLEHTKIFRLRTVRAETPSVKRTMIERVARAKSRDELLLDMFSELISQVTEKQRKQLETVTQSMEAERKNFSAS